MTPEIAAAPSQSSSTWSTFRTVEAEMRGSFLEREEPIRGLLVGLLAKQHVVLLGPPGTGKSAMAGDLCERIGGRYFSWLLTRFSTPEEIFGPVSLRGLEQDRYRRITAGKLPEADIVFLDEAFKANSAILNAMLAALNERRFYNDGAPSGIPLQMAVAASNEMPESEELAALWDRFALRYVVDYVSPGAFDALLQGPAPGGRTGITLDQLRQAQAEVQALPLNGAAAALRVLRDRMRDARIPVSDRRWKQLVSVLQAHAWMEGRASAGESDMVVLCHSLWQDPSQIITVRQAVLAIANPDLQKATDLRDQAQEVYQHCMSAQQKADKDPAVNASGEALEAVKKLRNLVRNLDELRTQSDAAKRDSSAVTGILAQVRAWEKDVMAKCLGI